MDQPNQNRQAWQRRSIVAGLIGLGLMIGTVAFAFGVLPLLMHVNPVHWAVTVALTFVAALCVLIGLVRMKDTLRSIRDAENLPEPERSDVLYGRYLVGVGFALLADAIICSVVVIALAWITGRARLGLVTSTGDREVQQNIVGDAFDAPPLDALATSGPAGAALDQLGTFFGNSADDAFFVAALFTLSMLVALLGALFFFANALWSKMREADRVPFDRSIFWAGLWFRIGEAVLFNLVFFLVLRYYAPEQYLALPLVSLFVGMFLKAGEKLVSGLATRVIEAFAALVPTNLKPPATLKLVTIRLESPPQDPARRAAMLSSLAKAIAALEGVERAIVDRDENVLVEYNPAEITVDRIRREQLMLSGEAGDDEPV